MPRILVIDDSPMLLELLVNGLTQAGYQALGAPNLAALDKQLKTGSFDAILVDVNMPEMFGDDVVEFLKSHRQVSSKLILYSDISEPDLKAKAAAVKADGYITKASGMDGTLKRLAEIVGAPSARPSASSPPPPQATAARKRRVLIVDDSEMTAKLLEADLTAKGFEVSTADNAEKATRIILKKQTRPDLVLLDVRMPNVNGEQFCRFIKGNSLFKGIKVLLCSGEDVEELQRICREAGADGFVAKDQVLSKVLSRELGS